MAIDLRNINNIKVANISNKNNKSSDLDVSQTHILNISKIDTNFNNKNLNHSVNNVNKIPKFNLVLVLYNIILLFILSSIVTLDWASLWQLPKVIVFVFGVTGSLILSSIFWIFGGIRHIIKITWGDIIFIGLCLSIVIISLLNPNQIAFWGSAPRIFDAGVFIIFLLLYYLLLKIFLESREFNIVFLGFVTISFIGVVIGSISIYLSKFNSVFPILDKLKPTSTWITESPKELSFISLLCLNVIFVFASKLILKNFHYKLLIFLYYVSVLVHIFILIRLPDYTMYVLTIISLITNWLLYVNKLSKNKTEIANYKLVTIRTSFIYGILIILISTFAVVKPFQNNSQLPEYVPLTVPDLKTTLNIVESSLKSYTWLGSGNVMYAWNKFNTSVSETQISDFSFETLYNEISNLIVRNGIIVTVFIILVGLWILLAGVRMIFIYKKIPAEFYILSFVITGLFIIPFTVVTKVFLILALVLWSNVFTHYFKPAFTFQLDINKIPASISSLLTFIMLFSIAGSVFVSTKFYNIIQSQVYVVKASKEQDNLSEQINLLAQAQNKSPYIVEYAHLYIPALIEEISQKAMKLSDSRLQSDNGTVDVEQQKLLQDQITLAQNIINNYRDKFSSETRVIYWQLDLYSVINKYGEVEEAEYLSLISKGRELQKNSLYWSLYEAQYYAVLSQKEQPINLEKLNKAQSILNDTISNNPYFVQAYQNYYDTLLLNQDYKKQIEILNKYVDGVISNQLVANQELVYLLGVAYQNNKQYEEAMNIYNKLLETFPKYTNVYFKLGEIYEIEKKFDLAKQNYQRVLELDPNASIVKDRIEKLK